MQAETVTVVQLLSIVLGAVGAPGVTFYVMKRMTREAICQIRENCKECKSMFLKRLDNVDGTIDVVEERQHTLRENMPLQYVLKDNFAKSIAHHRNLISILDDRTRFLEQTINRSKAWKIKQKSSGNEKE